MKKFIVIATLALSLLGTLACQKASNKSQAAPPPALSPDFIGTWSIDSYGRPTDPVSAGFVDNSPSEKGGGYMLFKISSAFDVTVNTQGMQNSEGKITSDPQTFTGIKLSMNSSTSGLLQLSDETAAQARAQGTTEAHIQEAQRSPCTLVLVTPMTARYECGNSPKINTNLTKINDAEALALQATSKIYFEKKSRIRNSLAKRLGGTSWTLVEVSTKTTGPNGRISERRETVSSMFNDSNGFYNGQTRMAINAKLISFSKDLESARINNKFVANVNLIPLQDRDSAKIAFYVKESETSFSSLFQTGTIYISEDKTKMTFVEDITQRNEKSRRTITYRRNRQ